MGAAKKLHPIFVMENLYDPRQAIFDVFRFILDNRDQILKDYPKLSSFGLHNMLFDLYQCFLWYNEISFSNTYGYSNMIELFESFK